MLFRRLIMKKIYLLIALLLSISAQAQQFTPKLAFDYMPASYKIKMSQLISATTGFNNYDMLYKYGTFRVRMGVSFTYNHFEAYADQHIYMQSFTGHAFNPSAAWWFIGAKYSITDKIKIRYEHLCIHPVIYDNDAVMSKMYGGYDLFSISYNY